MMSESPVKQKCTVKRGPTERFLGIKIRKEHTHKTSTVIVEKENNLKATASLLRKKASNFDGLIKNTFNCVFLIEVEYFPVIMHLSPAFTKPVLEQQSSPGGHNA